jgi:hypothetical protein
MGYPRRPCSDSPAIDPRLTGSRFVAAGLVYVCCALGFIVLAVTTSVALGAKLLEHELINFSVAWIALILVVVGVFLLMAFLFHLAWRPLQPFAGKTSQSGDLWDEQLDG